MRTRAPLHLFALVSTNLLLSTSLQPVTVNLIVLTDTPIVKDSGHFQIRDQTQDNRDWDCVCIIYTGIAAY